MFSIIAAVSENGVIGKGNTLPWRLSADLKRFSTLTKGHKVIMGRKTYESIISRIGKPLPDRTSIILTTNTEYSAPGCIVIHGIEDMTGIITKDEEVFIIGGEEVYRRLFPIVNKIYLTEVATTCDGDVFFPDWLRTSWVTTHTESFPRDEKNEFGSRFTVYEKRI